MMSCVLSTLRNVVFMFFCIVSFTIQIRAEEWPRYLEVYRLWNGACSVNQDYSQHPPWTHGYEGFSYTTDDTAYAVVHLRSGAGTYISLPSYYTDSSGKTYPIRSLGFGGYMDDVYMETLEIPDGVVELYNIYNDHLEKIILSSSVRIATLSSLPNLKEIVFSDGLKQLNLSYTSSLESLQIPSSVEVVRLRECSGLKELYVPKTVKYWEQSRDCPNVTNLVFNASLWVHTQDFRGWSSLKNVELGDDVKGICKSHYWSGTWAYLKGLTSPFPNSKLIETAKFGKLISGTLIKELFKDCKSLHTFRCTGAVTGLGDYDFYNCVSLTNIESAAKITSIGAYSLYNCQKLSNKVFDTSKCKKFGEKACFRCYAFGDTLNLTNATSIGKYAFSECKNITKIDYRNKNTTVPEHGFSYCTSLTNVLFTSNLKRIGNNAFYKCSNLEAVIVPENVTYIGTNAFSYCSKLDSVFFEGAPPSANKAFGSVASKARGFYVAKYKEQWNKVIGSDGKWNGLIMGPAVQPKLKVVEVDWIEGSIKLDWSKTESGENVTWPCILYRGTTDDFNSATPITGELTDTNYIDKDFLKVKPVIKPLYYWVKPVNLEIPYAASDALRTRYRSGLFVGFSNYANNPTTGKPWQGAFASIWPTTRSMADLFDSFGFDCALLQNPSSQMLSRTIAEKAAECKAGDVFLFWIFTHGGTIQTQEGRQTCLAMEPYLNRYFSSRMANDMSAFKQETVVVPIIYACHSGGMLDFSDASATFDIMEFINSGLAQCHSGQGGIAACSSKVTSPAVNGLATDVDSFVRFFIDSVDCADNGDGNLTLHEMVTYIQKQQKLFTPYAVAEEVNGGMVHDSLIMKENAKKVTGAPPSKPTGLRFVENNDGSVTFMWDAASGAKWYSDQGVVQNKSGFLYESSLTYDSMLLEQGESYIFTVYAGNEFGRSDGASITYSPSKGFVRLEASRNLSDGIKLSWDTNIGEGVVSKWVLFHPGGWFTSPERIAELTNTLKSCFHKIDDFQEHEYYILGYDYTGAEVVRSNVVIGRRVEVLSPSLSISPSSIEIPADCGGMEGCYFEIDVTADMTWSFHISDDSFCKDYFVDTGNTGRIYMYCRKNETPNTRSVVITVSMRKPDGSSIEKECVVIQRGNGESYPYEGSISRWKKQNGDMSENEFLTGQNGKGVPYLMCYAFQGNIADDEVPKLKIEMDDNGKPSISMPAQNPLTSLDVEVTLESSVDLQTWKNVIEDKDVELSDDGRRVIRYPRKNGNTEFFRFKVDLR